MANVRLRPLRVPDLAQRSAVITGYVAAETYTINKAESETETAVTHHLRVIVCETQSSNVPAIRAYRKLGFVLDAIDLSFYSNGDVEKESVALFMKRKL